MPTVEQRYCLASRKDVSQHHSKDCTAAIRGHPCFGGLLTIYDEVWSTYLRQVYLHTRLGGVWGGGRGGGGEDFEDRFRPVVLCVCRM